MSKKFIAAVACGLMLTGTAFAQKVKTKKEGEALMAIQNSQDPDSRIAAIENLLSKFADTEFKVIVLEMATELATMKNDPVQVTLYAERTLEADPNNIVALTQLARAISMGVREFDLDREEKLKKAEEYANKAIGLAPTAKKNTTMITDEQFAGRIKDSVSQCHEALAQAALVRKKNDVAVAEYKLALETAATPDPATMVRLGMAYNGMQKYDDAIAILDKAIATSDNATIKQVAGQEKVKAVTAKAAAAKKAAAPANQ